MVIPAVETINFLVETGSKRLILQNMFFIFPLTTKASREVANLTERKNLHTHVISVKEFVCLLSVYKYERAKNTIVASMAFLTYLKGNFR